MRKFIVYLLLGVLISIVVFPSFAQQNQNTSQQEIEALKKQLSEIQTQLKTVENAEKMELATQLADANTKLINADFDKMKLELKESNQQWLWGWTAFLGVMFAVFGLVLWFFVKSLIEDRVEERLNGFKESVEKVNILEGQLVTLKEEHAASVLEQNLNIGYNGSYAESVNVLLNEVLLGVYKDKTRRLAIRDKAAEVLADRDYSPIVSPILEYLNDVVDSDLDLDPEWETPKDIQHYLYRHIRFVEEICTDEAHAGLKQFLNRLITKEPKQKRLLLTPTVYSFAKVCVELNMRDSTSILKSAVSHLQDPDHNLSSLAECFAELNSPEGIKEIYNIHAKGKMSELEETCLNLLGKYEPDFVREQREEKASKTVGENTDEPRQPN